MCSLIGMTLFLSFLAAYFTVNWAVRHFYALPTTKVFAVMPIDCRYCKGKGFSQACVLNFQHNLVSAFHLIEDGSKPTNQKQKKQVYILFSFGFLI